MKWVSLITFNFAKQSRGHGGISIIRHEIIKKNLMITNVSSVFFYLSQFNKWNSCIKKLFLMRIIENIQLQKIVKYSLRKSMMIHDIIKKHFMTNVWVHLFLDLSSCIEKISAMRIADDDQIQKIFISHRENPL